jgi:hypothetical protein
MAECWGYLMESMIRLYKRIQRYHRKFSWKISQSRSVVRQVEKFQGHSLILTWSRSLLWVLLISLSSPLDYTPTNSSSTKSQFTTPVTHSSSTSNQICFATPSFLRAAHRLVQSPQSPFVPWQQSTRVKSFSALISDFKRIQDTDIDVSAHESWEDKDEVHSPSARHDNSLPSSQSRPLWKKGPKRSMRRTISETTGFVVLIIVRPVPAVEIPASDDDTSINPILATPEVSLLRELPPNNQAREANACCKPDIGTEDKDETPLTTRSASDSVVKVSNHSKPRKTKLKGRAAHGIHVSQNFVSYKIRGKGKRLNSKFKGRYRRY